MAAGPLGSALPPSQHRGANASRITSRIRSRNWEELGRRRSAGQRGTVSGAGGLGSLVGKHSGGVFCICKEAPGSILKAQRSREVVPGRLTKIGSYSYGRNGRSAEVVKGRVTQIGSIRMETTIDLALVPARCLEKVPPFFCILRISISWKSHVSITMDF